MSEERKTPSISDGIPKIPTADELLNLREKTGYIYYSNPDPVEPYFFSQDGDGHWYMIPVRLRAEWNTLNAKGYNDDDYEEWQKWSDYMTGGGIEDIEFIPTKQPE